MKQNERIKVRGKGKEKRESRLLITKAVPDVQEIQMSQEKIRDFKQAYGQNGGKKDLKGNV